MALRRGHLNRDLKAMRDHECNRERASGGEISLKAGGCQVPGLEGEMRSGSKRYQVVRFLGFFVWTTTGLRSGQETPVPCSGSPLTISHPIGKESRRLRGRLALNIYSPSTPSHGVSVHKATETPAQGPPNPLPRPEYFSLAHLSGRTEPLRCSPKAQGCIQRL